MITQDTTDSTWLDKTHEQEQLADLDVEVGPEPCLWCRLNGKRHSSCGKHKLTEPLIFAG